MHGVRRNGRGYVALAVALLVAAAVAVTASGARRDDAATMRTKVQKQLAQLISGSGKTRQKLPALLDSACRNPKQVKAGEIVLGYASPGRTNTWEIQNEEGGRYYLEHNPAVKKVYVTDGEDNPSKQISDVQSLISRGINLLVIDPATLAVSPAVQQACQRGIATVVYDRFVTDKTPVTASMYADEIQDGYNIGASIVKALEGKGNVVVLAGLPGVGVSDFRVQGAKQAFAQAKGIKVLAQGYTKYDPALGRQLMEQWLQKYPQIDAVWSDSGLQAQGAVEALKAANRLKDIKMLGGGQLNGYLRLCVQNKIPCSGSTISTDTGILAAQLGIDIVTGKTTTKANTIGPLVVIPPGQIKSYYRPDLPDSYWATKLLPNALLKQIYKKG
jgi:ribose transport system substrate-binding protein